MPIAKFTDNNTVSSTTKITPFFANRGFYPRISFSPNTTKYEIIREPFPIVVKVGDSYQLELYPIMKIENVFHPKYLRKTPNDLLPGHVQPPAPPIIIDREEEHEVDDTLDFKREYGRLKYRVQWKGSRVRDLI